MGEKGEDTVKIKEFVTQLSRAAGGLCLAISMAGCGGGGESAGAQARGKVSLDGKPLPGGVVLFIPREGSGQGGSALIQSDGTFVVRTSASKSGIDAGKYAVFIKPTDDMTDGGGIPPKYGDESNIELMATIQEGGVTELNFELTSGD